MADSENSRTLSAITRRNHDSKTWAAENLPPIIDRRNLLPVAARLLSSRVVEPDGQPRAPGPTPVRELWPQWYALYQRQMQACHFRKKLEAEMLNNPASVSVALQIEGADRPVVVHSFADIQRLSFQLDAEQITQALAELRQRRRSWKNADRRLGYSAALALEQDIAQEAGITGRVMGLIKPSSLIEVTAKLHCLIVTQDPALKLKTTPWPELRTMLKDLILMELRGC
ncbi:hypothetical protein [Pararhizobium sp. DWP1-1-3]|uniref:hypothetical protein n=1 Tax=Pararhizobium sp. DWP1-1-3 TaxID=2804652 RepID=UPI003CE7E132